MKIHIFVEGGGDTKVSGRASMRQGFETLLGEQKEAARQKRLRWQLGLYGSRGETVKAFRDAISKGDDDLAVLLVDAEALVADSTPSGRVTHLKDRVGWDFASVDPNWVHLMTQCMEAWIVADPERIEDFYGKGFRRNALPSASVLDEVPKSDLFSSLEQATAGTRHGRYRKIAHASKILERIRPDVLKTRCTSFRQLVEWLDHAIASA